MKQTKKSTGKPALKMKTVEEKTPAPFGLEWMRNDVDLLRYKSDLEGMSDTELSLLLDRYLSSFVGIVAMYADLPTVKSATMMRSVARFARLALEGDRGTPVSRFLRRMVNRYFEDALTPRMIQEDLSKVSDEFRHTADEAASFKELYPTQRF